MIKSLDETRMSAEAYRSAIRVGDRRGQDPHGWHCVLAHLAGRIRLGIGASYSTSIKRAGSFIPAIESQMGGTHSDPVSAYLQLEFADARLKHSVPYTSSEPPEVPAQIRQLMEHQARSDNAS